MFIIRGGLNYLLVIFWYYSQLHWENRQFARGLRPRSFFFFFLHWENDSIIFFRSLSIENKASKTTSNYNSKVLSVMIPIHNALYVTQILRCDKTWDIWGLEMRSESRRHSLCDPRTLHHSLRYLSFALGKLQTIERLEGKRPTEESKRYITKTLNYSSLRLTKC